jgi:hypothetical protein
MTPKTKTVPKKNTALVQSSRIVPTVAHMATEIRDLIEAARTHVSGTANLAWLKEHDWREGENEPVGRILCTSARRQHVELLLRHGPHQMKAAEYLTRLPDKRLLEERLKMYGRLLKDRDGEHAAVTDL